MPDTAADTNNFAKSVREKVAANIKLVEEIFFDSPPLKYLSDGNTSMVAPIYSHHLLNEARDALSQNNIKDAADKLRREVDFCNTVPKMRDSPYNKSGEAGLKAIKQKESAAQITGDMEKAWNESWKNDPAPFYRKKLHGQSKIE